LSGASDELTIISQALIQVRYSNLFIIDSVYILLEVFCVLLVNSFMFKMKEKRTGVSNCDVMSFIFCVFDKCYFFMKKSNTHVRMYTYPRRTVNEYETKQFRS
jgi:hypothetical protein